jgi:uncharacterized protein (DUF433 family)
MEVTPTMLIPLIISDSGVIRVGDTRVRLDTIVYAFNEGYTAEEIVTQYPSLTLSDVYAVIAYYLNERQTVDEYISQRLQAAQAIRAEIESKPEYRAFRQKLLDRRDSSLP